MHSRVKIVVLEAQPSYKEAVSRLIRALSDGRFSLNKANPFMLRMEVSFPKAKLLPLLVSATCAQKLYWSDRGRSFEWAGFGTAIRIENGESALSAALGSQVQLFAVMRFDQVVPVEDASWASYPKGCFILPLVELRSDEDGAKIILNLNANEQRTVDEALELLRGLMKSLAVSVPFKMGAATKTARAMSLEEWSCNVAKSAQYLEANELDKIVLANAHDFWFERPVDAASLLARLDEKSPSTYRFLVQLSPHHAFLGASPEQLFARNGMRIESEAQAGTRPRGKSEEEDASLAEELLSSEKEFIEHDFVFQDIESSLSALCRDSGWFDQRKIIKLSHVQHLRSRFGGIVNEGVTDRQILNALHPTPAVCGRPKADALRHIRGLEQFDRGYYCGPIGLIGKNKTELAVALRSALVTDCRVRVFAGAGLVKGSKARDEWNEIDSKMRLYYEVFGI